CPQRHGGRRARPALPRAAAAGHAAAPHPARAACLLPGSLGGRADPLGRQTDARRRAPVRPRPRDLPAAARTGPPGGGDPLLRGRHGPCGAHRLLGPPAAAHAGPPAPRARALSLSARLPPPSTTACKMLAHSPPADGPL